MSMFSMDLSQVASMTNKWGLMSLETRTKIDITMEAAAIIVQTHAKQQAPTKTGKLRSSISHQVTSNALESKAIIAPHASYAGYVNAGRGEVVPKNKKVLASKINPGWGSKNAAGYYIIGKRSKAVPANPFMQRAYLLSVPEVIALFSKLRTDVIGKVL